MVGLDKDKNLSSCNTAEAKRNTVCQRSAWQAQERDQKEQSVEEEGGVVRCEGRQSDQQAVGWTQQELAAAGLRNPKGPAAWTGYSSEL